MPPRRSVRDEPSTPWGMRVAFSVVIVLVAALLVELGVRIVFATQAGPRVLLYGTSGYRNTLSVPRPERGKTTAHRNRLAGYSKYFPGETRYTRSADSRDLIPIRINNHGFRGRDFEVEKEPGVVRVLTLGASSTFGYRNGDDETYPYLLQQILDASGRGTRYEVINFAIPHANSSNVLAMFLAEGVRLRPDVVTLYAGMNDSAAMEVERADWLLWLRERFLVVEYASTIAAYLEPDEMKSIEAILEPRSAGFLENLSELRDECDEIGARLIVMTQQSQSLMVPPEKLRGLRYRDEVQWVERALSEESGDRPKRFDAAHRLTWGPIFLVHAGLMRDLRRWVRANDVGFVDVIALLDDRRDLLLSWVHLHPEANRRIAEALAREILRETAPETGTPNAGADASATATATTASSPRIDRPRGDVLYRPDR